MALLYRTWFGFSGWLAAVVLWLVLFQGQVLWWQPAALWALFALLWLITRKLGAHPGALPFTAALVFLGWIFLTRLDPHLAQGHFRAYSWEAVLPSGPAGASLSAAPKAPLGLGSLEPAGHHPHLGRPRAVPGLG